MIAIGFDCHQTVPSAFRKSLAVIAILAGFLAIVAPAAQAGDSLSAAPSVFPLNVMQDSATFIFYLNEEPLVTSHCLWKPDGAFASEYTVSMAGQAVTASMAIAVDDAGNWTTISMTTAKGVIQAVREDTLIKISANGQTQTARLRPNTLLFENFCPSLMSQAIAAYDQARGGTQTFPLFIIPAMIMDATLERLETAERNVMGRFQQFTLYRFGLPGVDVTLWMDDQNRVCLGDVPAQKGAYVRKGYEGLWSREEPDTLLSQPKYDVVVDSNVGAPMRDGVKLATDMYRPKAEGKFPVVLVRTPYKKEMEELQARYYARRGYVYVVQDCRGRFSSPGKWEPFFNESKDGYDAVEWLAVQPWSNGKVGMIGGSYVGWVQWWAARERPPHLVTIIPNVSPPDPYFNIPYEYGAFFLMGAIWWADILEQEATGDLSGEAMSRINSKEYATLLRQLPVIDLDKKVLGKKNRYWRDWIAHPDNDAWWDRASFLKYLDSLDIPVYHQSGWYDGDGIGSKLNYTAMASRGHKCQKLVLGPWGHTAEAMRTGPRNTDFGPNAIIDLGRSYTRWLDHWLLGIDNGIDREPLVSLFVMGSDQWLHGDRYPLPETKFTKFYLAGDGSANSAKGNGKLAVDPVDGASAVSDTFTYDPGDPTPDPSFYVSPKNREGAPKSDSSKVESVEESIEKVYAYYGEVDDSRRDILVYDTPPLKEPLTFAGPISAVLYAASSAKDTDWFMRLSMIDSAGGVFPLTHGVIRARYRNSFAKPELLTPGQIYEYRLDMWQTGITVPAGSKLRVEVCSASFPMFSRNLNTGKHNETEKKYVSAHQTIYHDKDHPSHILLPVIENPKFGEK